MQIALIRIQRNLLLQWVGGNVIRARKMCCMPMIFVLTKSIADAYVVLT